MMSGLARHVTWTAWRPQATTQMFSGVLEATKQGSMEPQECKSQAARPLLRQRTLGGAMKRLADLGLRRLLQLEGLQQLAGMSTEADDVAAD